MNFQYTLKVAFSQLKGQADRKLSFKRKSFSFHHYNTLFSIPERHERAAPTKIVFFKHFTMNYVTLLPSVLLNTAYDLL